MLKSYTKTRNRSTPKKAPDFLPRANFEAILSEKDRYIKLAKLFCESGIRIFAKNPLLAPHCCPFIHV